MYCETRKKNKIEVYSIHIKSIILQDIVIYTLLHPCQISTYTLQNMWLVDV